jgi:DnaJ-class molecular chaperone
MKELIQRLRDEARRVRQMAEGGGEQAALYMTCRDHGAACDAYIASHAAGHASNAAGFAGLVADMEQAADALERLSACPHCNGDGWIVKMGKGRMDCPQCDGTGKSEVMRHDP